MNNLLAEMKIFLSYNPDSGEFTWVKYRRNISVGQVAGTYDKDGYVQISFNRKFYKAHRLAWAFVYGEFPEGPLDHINRVKSDNSIYNLRLCTISQNAINRFTKDGKPLGVGRDKRSGSWYARIAKDGKSIWIGSFQTAEQAALARSNKEIEIFGEFSPNFKKVTL